MFDAGVPIDADRDSGGTSPVTTDVLARIAQLRTKLDKLVDQRPNLIGRWPYRPVLER